MVGATLAVALADIPDLRIDELHPICIRATLAVALAGIPDTTERDMCVYRSPWPAPNDAAMDVHAVDYS